MSYFGEAEVMKLCSKVEVAAVVSRLRVQYCDVNGSWKVKGRRRKKGLIGVGGCAGGLPRREGVVSPDHLYESRRGADSLVCSGGWLRWWFV